MSLTFSSKHRVLHLLAAMARRLAVQITPRGNTTIAPASVCEEFVLFLLYRMPSDQTLYTRSTTHLKLKHSLSKSFSAGHFYFNRLPRLWNSLPPLDLDQSLQSLKKYLWTFLWSQFELKFKSDIPCSFHLSCPCPKCVQSSFSVNYTLPMGTSAS